MKRLFVVGGICAALMLGTAMTALAQDEHKDDKQEPQPAENRRAQPRPEDRKNQEAPKDRQEQPRTDEHPMKQQEKEQQQQNERQMKQQEKEQQHEMKQQEKEQQQTEKQNREQERRGQAQQPVNGGARPHEGNQRRVSDHDFHAHFGREHRFHPGRMQVFEGRPQFHYSGYVFEIVNPWPAAWSYDADDYYIDYFDDEYWLCSLIHPELRLEVVIIG